MTPADLTKKVEDIYQERLKNPNDFYSDDWDKYWLECLSVKRESHYIDLLNRNNIPFVRKAIIMTNGEVLNEDAYAAWYFTYPELVKPARKLISVLCDQIHRGELKDSILALSPEERQCFDRVCKHGTFKGKTDRALLKTLIEKELVTKSKYYVDRKHWMWQYNPMHHLLKEVWSELPS